MRNDSSKNREHALAVFLFLVILPLLLVATSGCKSSSDEEANNTPAVDSSDVYTLELLKDRLVKDKDLLSNPSTPIKASDMGTFRGLAYYPPDKRFALPVVLQRLGTPEEIVMATSKDKPRLMLYIGDFRFTLQGKDCALRVYAPKDTSDGNYWFIPFTDLTTGGDSYEGGRYIDIEDTRSDSTFLDFNYAYNPYCAYNERYDCPIPPAENALPVAITAGEKRYPLGHAH